MLWLLDETEEKLMRLSLCLVLGSAAFASGRPAAAQSNGDLSFDGQNDRVTVPYDDSFPGGVFSIAAWIKLPPPGHNSAIIARGEDDNSFDLVWHLYVVASGDLRLMVEESNMTNHCYPVTCMGGVQPACQLGDIFVADDTWHHIAATRDVAGLLNLYVDGIAVATCTGTAEPSTDNSQDLTIGCTHGTIGPPPGGEEPPTWFFPGRIDEPAMWNLALTASQVLDVFSNGVDPGAAGLVGYWTFDEGTGQNVLDASPLANHGFLGEAPNQDIADPQWVITKSDCPQDINADGAVNVLDLIDLLLCFGLPAVPGCEAQDVNADGNVNVLDLIDLLLVFGTSCP